MTPKSKKGKLITLFTMKMPDGMVHHVGFIVSKRRKLGHLTAVVRQTAASNQARLSPYSQSLFESCFKNW